MLKLDKINKINRFFTKLYKVSLNVDIYYYNDSNTEVKGNHDNVSIYINRKAPEMDQEFAVVHEMNHIYQQLGYSITVPEIAVALAEDEEVVYARRKQEIDSRIVELLYAESEFGEYGVELLKDRLYKGCPIFTPNLSKAIFNLPDCKVKEILVKDLDSAYVAVDETEKQYGKYIKTI